MGQTTGGSAGNLELIKQIEEQRAEIEELKEKLPLRGSMEILLPANQTINATDVYFEKEFKKAPYVFTNVVYYGNPNLIEFRTLAVLANKFVFRIKSNMANDATVKILYVAFENIKEE